MAQSAASTRKVGFQEPSVKWSEERSDPRSDLKGLSINELEELLSSLRVEKTPSPDVSDGQSTERQELQARLSELESDASALLATNAESLSASEARDLYVSINGVIRVVEHKRAYGQGSTLQVDIPPPLPPRRQESLDNLPAPVPIETILVRRTEDTSGTVTLSGGSLQASPNPFDSESKTTTVSKQSRDTKASNNTNNTTTSTTASTNPFDNPTPQPAEPVVEDKGTVDAIGSHNPFDSPPASPTGSDIESDTSPPPPIPARPPPRALPPVPQDDPSSNGTNPFGDDDDDDDSGGGGRGRFPTFTEPLSTRIPRGGSARVFGVYLGQAVEKSCLPGDDIPCLVRRCLEYLNGHGGREEGLYRMCGAASEISRLKLTFESGADVPNIADVCKDPHVVTGLLKAYLRDLPDSPTLPETQDSAELSSALSKVDKNYVMLYKNLMSHFAQVSANEDRTKMSARNLGICLCPTMRIPAITFTAMIQHHDTLFS